MKMANREGMGPGFERGDVFLQEERALDGPAAGLWEMTTSEIQQKGFPKTNPHINGEIPLCRRSGNKPLDPRTLPSRGTQDVVEQTTPASL